MKILGIDVGLDGGMVLLSDYENHAVKRVMPTINITKGKRQYDMPAVVSFIDTCKADHVFIEKAQAFPGQGVRSMFSIGLGYGMLLGIVNALSISHTVVRPQAWQKVMFQSLEKTDTKKMAYIVCTRLWPGHDWRASERARKPHSGLCDAAMIAEFGRRTLASA